MLDPCKVGGEGRLLHVLSLIWRTFSVARSGPEALVPWLIVVLGCSYLTMPSESRDPSQHLEHLEIKVGPRVVPRARAM